MPKFEVELTRVFGACFISTVTVEAKDKDEAIDLAKDTDWTKVIDAITPDNLSDEYKFAEIKVDGKPTEQTMYGDDLLNQAIELQKMRETN